MYQKNNLQSDSFAKNICSYLGINHQTLWNILQCTKQNISRKECLGQTYSPARLKNYGQHFWGHFFFCVFRARLPNARDARAMRQKRARGETHARGGTKKGTFFSAPPSCIQLFEFASTRLKKGKNWPSFYKLNIFFSSLDFVITLTLPFSYSIEMRAYEAAIIISV